MPTPTKPAHTPTPWTMKSPNGDGYATIQDSHGVVALNVEINRAARIVQAVNAHQELIETLTKEHEAWIRSSDYNDVAGHIAGKCDVCSLLAQAEGK